MIDIDLLVNQLRNNGHSVDSVIPLPENAGLYEFIMDDHLITLDEARLILEQDQERRRAIH